jgi:hypothetical protein
LSSLLLHHELVVRCLSIVMLLMLHLWRWHVTWPCVTPSSLKLVEVNFEVVFEVA